MIALAVKPRIEDKMLTLWQWAIKAISNAGNGGMQGMGECGMSDFMANLYSGNVKLGVDK
jgi:hypothetical protein